MTFVSTTLVVGWRFADFPPGFEPRGLWELVLHPASLRAGLAFSLPLLAILLCHEMGHYLACRTHRLDATLPYFLPVPFGIGTFGAFIRIRTPLSNKRELFDVGASGPLAGFLVAIPVLALGIALSRISPEIPKGSYIEFGEPLLFKLLAFLIHGPLPDGASLNLHPTGYAGWWGLLVTALNLLPFGQLDGGHVTYSVLGQWQRRLAWPLLLVLVGLGFVWIGWWVWAVLALVMGARHPRVLDEPVKLDPKRLWLALACLLIFALCFCPEPIRFVD
jgi:membrane-associated protease RseP (regulator of RpoE activity)